jgi:hypothetical protein
VNNSYGQSWYKIYGYAGKTVAWCPSDSEIAFNQNMANANTRAKLEEYGWTKDNISYTFNKEGFRADEFTDGVDDSVLFLGCSHTVGIGLDLESTWSYKVAHSLGLRRYNLAIGAGSADTCFRLAHHWIPRLRPKYVMMLTPAATRIELVKDKDFLQFLSGMHPHVTTSGFYEHWLSNSANFELNRLKNVMGVRTICNGIGTPLVEIPIDKLFNRTMTPSARDLMHPGREWNEAVAGRFLEKL